MFWTTTASWTGGKGTRLSAVVATTELNLSLRKGSGTTVRHFHQARCNCFPPHHPQQQALQRFVLQAPAESNSEQRKHHQQQPPHLYQFQCRPFQPFHLHQQQKRWHGGPTVAADAPTVAITFCHADGETKSIVNARIGETILQTVRGYSHDNPYVGLDLEGACEGVCACSTCHVIVASRKIYNALPAPSEDEEDMLDLAFGLEETSRLGCQITVTQDMEGAEFRLPAATRNFYVDGHVPKPH